LEPECPELPLPAPLRFTFAAEVSFVLPQEDLIDFGWPYSVVDAPNKRSQMYDIIGLTFNIGLPYTIGFGATKRRNLQGRKVTKCQECINIEFSEGDKMVKIVNE